MSMKPSSTTSTRVPTRRHFGFIDALEQAYAHIGRYPAKGSPHYAQELNLPGLRCWPLKRYPPILFSISSVTITSTCGTSCTANGTFQRGCANPMESDTNGLRQQTAKRGHRRRGRLVGISRESCFRRGEKQDLILLPFRRMTPPGKVGLQPGFRVP
jgi:hypothetical protein